MVDGIIAPRYEVSRGIRLLVESTGGTPDTGFGCRGFRRRIQRPKSRDEPRRLSPAGRDDVEVYAEMRTPTESQRVELGDFKEFEDFGQGTKCDTWPMSSVEGYAGKR